MKYVFDPSSLFKAIKEDRAAVRSFNSRACKIRAFKCSLEGAEPV